MLVLPPTHSGISVGWLRSAASVDFSSLRSALPGAYARTGSLIGWGTEVIPAILRTEPVHGTPRRGEPDRTSREQDDRRADRQREPEGDPERRSQAAAIVLARLDAAGAEARPAARDPERGSAASRLSRHAPDHLRSAGHQFLKSRSVVRAGAIANILLAGS